MPKVGKSVDVWPPLHASVDHEWDSESCGLVEVDEVLLAVGRSLLEDGSSEESMVIKLIQLLIINRRNAPRHYVC